MRHFYNLGIFLYGLLIRLVSPFHKKASLWVQGRKDWEHNLEKKLDPGAKIIWMHCASLGEFEQGRPLLEAIRKEAPHYKLLLTFFSPSGFEVRKNYEGADIVSYLPLDTPRAAATFIDLVKPEKVFFIKYEFWFNYLEELRKRNTEAYLVSAIFREEQLFFKKPFSFAREGLRAYRHMFVQDENSKNLLASIGYTNVTIAGDTRFDRVLSIAEKAAAIEVLEKFAGGEHVLVAGSTWPEDEQLLFRLDLNKCKLIIAPHEVSPARVADLLKGFSAHAPVLFSEAGKAGIGSGRILIIDSIGLLSSVYKYGSAAYVGGGFGKGIHNVLEPAVFGMPVLFGPRFEKFREAVGLVAAGAAFCVHSFEELETRLHVFFSDEQLLQLIGQAARYFVKGQSGATEQILDRCIRGGK